MNILVQFQSKNESIPIQIDYAEEWGGSNLRFTGNFPIVPHGHLFLILFGIQTHKHLV